LGRLGIKLFQKITRAYSIEEKIPDEMRFNKFDSGGIIYPAADQTSLYFNFIDKNDDYSTVY
jgi:hypothetical protein